MEEVTIFSEVHVYTLSFSLSVSALHIGCALFFLRFYLFIYEKHRERGRDTGKGRSKLPVGSPRTPGSRPEPKADAQPLSYPGAPGVYFQKMRTECRFIRVSS